MTPCVTPGCPSLVEHGRCTSCQEKADTQDRDRRGSATERGYGADWVVVRDAYAHAHPLCEDCLEQGRVVAMDIVDHKIPLPHGPRLDTQNLRSLCRSCHGVKTARDRAAGYEANTAASASDVEPRRWVIA